MIPLQLLQYSANDCRVAVKQLVKASAICLGLAGILAVCLDAFGINLLNFGTLDVARNTIAFWVYFQITLLFVPGQKHLRLPLVLLIPIFTQLYQVGLGWDLPGGPSSISRIAPYLGVMIFMVSTLVADRVKVSAAEWGFVIAVNAIGITGAILGSTDQFVSLVTYLAVGILLPLYYFFIKRELAASPFSAAQLEASALIGFLTLTVGTLAIIRMGSEMTLGGVTGLLGTRNVSDYNLVLAYLILLWPFALRAARAISPLMVAFALILLLASAIMGLSRTGLMFVPILAVSGIYSVFKDSISKGFRTTIWIALLGTCAFLAFPQKDQLGTVWLQRLNLTESSRSSSIVSKLKPGGEDSIARDQLRMEGYRLFTQSPVMGQGYGGFGESSRRGFRDAHSMTFTALAETGILGLVALYFVLAVVGLRLFRLATAKSVQDGGLFFICFLMWLFAVHSVGGNLTAIQAGSFTVGAINGILLMVYLWAGPVLRRSTSAP